MLRNRTILLLLAVWMILALGCVLAWDAEAMEVGIQDQGAAPHTVAQVGRDFGAHTMRFVVRAGGDAQAARIKAAKAEGYRVQAAILVKRTTTAGDVRALLRRWDGAVSTVSVGNEPDLNGVPAGTYVSLYARSRALIRREFPEVKTVCVGELSPARAFEYLAEMARAAKRQHRKVKADCFAVHSYQFFSDPLARPTEQSGIGTWLGLGNLGSFRRALKKAGMTRRIRVTEFSYMVDGPYGISMAKCASQWPRAIASAKRYAEQLIIYGIGVVPAGTWGSACLLDAQGRRTPAYVALAKALGRTLSPEFIPVPVVQPLLPNGEAPVAPHVIPVPDPAPAQGAQAEEPEEPTEDVPPVTEPPVEEPAPVPPVETPAEPAPEPDPVTPDVG